MQISESTTRRLTIFFTAATLVLAVIYIGAPEQAAAATKFIRDDATGGDCTAIGNWDSATKTCTLATDIIETSNDLFLKSIQIVSDNIILDGNGHKVQGQGVGNGIILFSVNGVTVKNVIVSGFETGINTVFGGSNNLLNSTVTSNNVGIVVSESSNNLTQNNNASFNRVVGVYSPSGRNNNNNRFIGNIVSHNGVGFGVSAGIFIVGAQGNIIENNFASFNNGPGVALNVFGGHPSNNVIRLNRLLENSGNDLSLGVEDILGCSTTIVEDNLGSGERPIKYFNVPVNLKNEELAHLILCNADGSTIEDVRVRGSETLNNNGIILRFTENAFIERVVSSDNSFGISLSDSPLNTIKDSSFERNTFAGISMSRSVGNIIFHNNFVDNGRSPSVSTPNQFSFPLPTGGNYWTEFDTPAEGCNDVNNNGICDSPFVFFGGQDNFPFVRKDGWKSPKMINPTELGVITNPFNNTSTPKIRHLGIDIDHAIDGEPVRVVSGGTIIRIVTSTDPGLSDWGSWAWISHGEVSKLDGTIEQRISTLYLHLSNVTTSFSAGSAISQGAVLGLADSTGLHTGPHLHFSVRQGDIPAGATSTANTTTTALDPLKFVDYALSPRYFSVTVKSPVDIILTDPDGLVVNQQANGLGSGAAYSEVKFAPDNSAASIDEGLNDYDSIAVDERKDGDYLISVVPEAGASPTDVYTLYIATPTTTIILANNVQVDDIPDQPYIVRSDAAGITKIIPLEVRIDPDVLNLSGRGQFTAFISIDKGFGVTIKDIDLTTITLEGVVPVKTLISDGINLVAQFRTEDFSSLSAGEEIKLNLQGKLFDGTKIIGSDEARVLPRRSVEINQLTYLLANLQSALQGLLNLLGTF